MRVWRSLLSGAFFVCYGVAALPFAALLLLPIWPAAAVRRVVRAFYRVFVFFARLTRLVELSVDATTRDELHRCRGSVVVMNHVSLVDICFLMALLPDSTAVAKAATLRNPFLGMVVRRILIANDTDAEKMLAVACRHLNAGVNVIVFPQGTRGSAEFHRGAARIALAAKCGIKAFRIGYEPVVLAKGQPWWDVGNRQIMVKLRYCGELAADCASNRHNALVLTEQIREMIK